MKPVLLSADGAPEVFMVPDEVAGDLRRYCLEFCEWLRESAYAAKYRHHETFDANGKRVSCCLHYDHRDFVDYLNTWLFPDQPSHLVGELDALKGKDPRYAEYLNAPGFNF